MEKLSGYIVSIKKLLSICASFIEIEVANETKQVHELKENRRYIIPDYQREIRWEADNVSELIEDVSKRAKHLGNMIFAHNNDENTYEIIDGQQRATTILMILAYIRQKYGMQFNVFSTCKLDIESFSKFADLLENYFPEDMFENADVTNSDKLQQREKYYELWNIVGESSVLKQKRRAQDFLANLENCTINIVLNKSAERSNGIGHFIDVNLKGLQLDDEDVFKGYLFKNDIGDDIRREWYQFKQNVVAVKKSRMEYPLLKLIEHYLYCDLYNNPKFEGIQFGENLRIKEEFTTIEDAPETFRKGTHIVEVISDNSYFIKAFKELNATISIMLGFVRSETLTDDIKSWLHCSVGGDLEHDEKVIIHNFISKTLKDKNVLPKALIMKYILLTILPEAGVDKQAYRKIYGVYLLSVLFVIFENKKSKDAFSGVLKSRSEDWYNEVVLKVKGQFDNSKPTQAKLVSAVKHSENDTEEDYKFRCKSLATIYNFFKVSERAILCEPIARVKTFVSDDDSYSIEHLIIGQSNKIKIKPQNGIEFDYDLLPDIKKYRMSIFNFIFIAKRHNEDLSNYWLPEKLYFLADKEIPCEYSKMINEKLTSLSEEMKNSAEESANGLDTFFARKFRDLYIDYARTVLTAIINKLTHA